MRFIGNNVRCYPLNHIADGHVLDFCEHGYQVIDGQGVTCQTVFYS